MTYKEKLIAWNNTPKYINELSFLLGLLGGGQGGRILDYGCGIMTAIKYLSLKTNHFIYGYDVVEYADEEYKHLYDNNLQKKYDVIYFMHSLAHIKNPLDILNSLRDNLMEGGRVIIITPNKQWMDYDYKGDETVIDHFDLENLSKLVEEAGFSIQQIGQFGEIRKDIHKHNRLNCERLFVIIR